MMRSLLAVVCACGVLGGCASEIVVSKMADAAKPGDAVDGIPFRMPKRFVAAIYQLGDKGYKKLETQEEIRVTVPDPDNLYVLGFRGQVLSNGSVDLTMNPDNTIAKVTLGSESKGAAAITAASTQLNAIATAEQNRIKASTAATAASASATTSAMNLSIAADKAKQTADLAELQHQLLKANAKATPEELLKAAQRERSTKLDANEAARLAGKSSYFPDVYP